MRWKKAELEARYEIYLENYCKTVNIEALTMLDMVSKDVLPAISAFISSLCTAASAKKNAFPGVDISYEETTVRKLSSLSGSILECVKTLDETVKRVDAISDSLKKGMAMKNEIIPQMETLRACVDDAETVTSSEYWPYPSYGDLLYGVQ